MNDGVFFKTFSFLTNFSRLKQGYPHWNLMPKAIFNLVKTADNCWKRLAQWRKK